MNTWRQWWLLLVLLAVGLLAARELRADPMAAETIIGEAITITVQMAEITAVDETVAEPQSAAAEVTPRAYLPMVIKPYTFSAEARAVLDLVNDERAQAGCGPVALQEQLTAAAQGHSEDMALNDYFDHDGQDGTEFWERILATGYRYRGAAENIAAGQTSPGSVVATWMNSDGHRKNILNCSYTEMGLGYYYLANDPGNYRYRHYWTQVFAQPR